MYPRGRDPNIFLNILFAILNNYFPFMLIYLKYNSFVAKLNMQLYYTES